VRPVDVAQAAALLEHERNHRPGRWAYGRKAALAMDLLRAYARSTHLRKVVGSRRTIAMQQRSHAFIPNPDTIRGAWRKTCLLVMTPRTMQLRHRRGGFVTTQSKVATLAAPSRDAFGCSASGTGVEAISPDSRPLSGKAAVNGPSADLARIWGRCRRR